MTKKSQIKSSTYFARNKKLMSIGVANWLFPPALTRPKDDSDEKLDGESRSLKPNEFASKGKG
jgi:hypothetical protein